VLSQAARRGYDAVVSIFGHDGHVRP
jgi:hypothetical protein